MPTSTAPNLSSNLVCLIGRDENDRQPMAEALATCGVFGVGAAWTTLGAAEQASELAGIIEASVWEVLIVARHEGLNLPAMLALLTTRPVLGVPLVAAGDRETHLELLDGLGEPTGAVTFALGKAGAANAALQAIAILALTRPELRERLLQFRREQTEKVLAEQL